MKRIYYLLALLALAFTACQKQPLGSPTVSATYVKSLSLTLASADYQKLPTSVYANKQQTFNSTDDAKTYIPAILNAREPQLTDGSSATVTFALAPVTIKLVDSLNADDAYTLTPADYLLLPKNTFTDFSTAQILSWLPFKYTAPVANQLEILTYTYFESGKTSNSGVPATDAFLYLNGAWQKIYRVSNAQYASIGNGVNNWFIAADVPNLIPDLNAFLKADPTVSTTAKAGDVKYVNYRYLTTYQRVLPLTFDGTNWVTTPTTATLAFSKTNGSWAPDNTVSYTLVQADYTYMGTQSPSTIGSTAARANIASFPDFNTSASTDATYWANADITAIIADLVKHKYAGTAVANQKFVITYTVYNFGVTTNKTKTYQYDGTNFNSI